jgi:hypothetical protein
VLDILGQMTRFSG